MATYIVTICGVDTQFSVPLGLFVSSECPLAASAVSVLAAPWQLPPRTCDLQALAVAAPRAAESQMCPRMAAAKDKWRQRG
jgi:hypothetical protein